MRIAFIIGKFPTLSESFILNQIVGLMERGQEINIYAQQPGDTAKIHPDVEKYQLLERTYLLCSMKLPNRSLRGLAPKGCGWSCIRGKAL
jgi:colanic acid/amylovoran biosynthesis glycosyltransferase